MARGDERPSSLVKLGVQWEPVAPSGFEWHHTSQFLVPKSEAPLPKPAPKRQDGRGPQHWIRVMTLLQPIVGDAGVQMMNVM